MNEPTKYTLCRIIEQNSIIEDLKRDPKRTLTARRMIMNRMLREELSYDYLKGI